MWELPRRLQILRAGTPRVAGGPGSYPMGLSQVSRTYPPRSSPARPRVAHPNGSAAPPSRGRSPEGRDALSSAGVLEVDRTDCAGEECGVVWCVGSSPSSWAASESAGCAGSAIEVPADPPVPQDPPSGSDPSFEGSQGILFWIPDEEPRGILALFPEQFKVIELSHG